MQVVLAEETNYNVVQVCFHFLFALFFVHLCLKTGLNLREGSKLSASIRTDGIVVPTVVSGGQP